MSQLNPASSPHSQTSSPDLVVKGKVNIFARDMIVMNPLQTVKELADTEENLPIREVSEDSAEDLAAKLEARDRTLEEYRQLQYQLLLTTLAIALIIFLTVWAVYSLPIALNYLLGGCTGVVYLKMLARDVEQLGNQKDSLGYARLAPFLGLMIIATRWQDLQIVPIFLGFLTYKAAIIVYVLRTSFS